MTNDAPLPEQPRPKVFRVVTGAWIFGTWLRRQIRVVRFGDRVIATLDTHCPADSVSQREFLVREGVVANAKLSVLSAGSIGGVELKRFDPGICCEQRGPGRGQPQPCIRDLPFTLSCVFVTRQKAYCLSAILPKIGA